MSKVSSWEVTDDFWMRVQALIPPRQRVAGKTYVRKPGGGRRPKDARLVFEGIVYVLRTGCQWKALPAERFGSASAIHARFCNGNAQAFLKPYGRPVWPNMTTCKVLPGVGKVSMAR